MFIEKTYYFQVTSGNESLVTTEVRPGPPVGFEALQLRDPMRQSPNSWLAGHQRPFQMTATWQPQIPLLPEAAPPPIT